MTPKKYPTLVHEWFKRIWEEGDLDAIGELMHPENLSVGLVNDPVGPESFKAVHSAFRRIVASITVDIEDVFKDGDRLAGRWSIRGIHRASGRRITFPGALFARVKDGRFLECSNYLDYLDLFVQTGALPEDTISRLLDEGKGGIYVGALGSATLSDMARVWEVNEHHFSTLFETGVTAMALVDADDRIVKVNRVFAREFGSSDSELVGGLFRNLIHPTDQVEESRLFRSLRDNPGGQYQLELRLLRDDAVMWVQLTTVGPQDTAEGQRFLRAVQDITTRRLEKMVQFQEQERRMLATDLHDALAQNLALLLVQVQTARALLGKDENRVAALLAEAVRQGQRASQELNVMMRNLRSPVAEGVELVRALKELSLNSTDGDCEVTYECNVEPPVPPGLASLFAYRIVQEAVQNARRHGQATRVDIALSSADGRLKVRVTDNGCGFEMENTDGSGIGGMRERCELMGGRFSLASVLGEGTTVRFELPVMETD